MKILRIAVSLVPDFLGIFALLLPFVLDISPYDALHMTEPIPSWKFKVFAVPLFLSIPIGFWMVFRLLYLRVSNVEMCLAYLFSIAAMGTLPIALVISTTWQVEGWATRENIALVILTVLFGVSTVVLLYQIVKHVPGKLISGVFIHTAYLPHAMFLLIGLFELEWKIGAWFVLGACCGYSVRAILLFNGKMKLQTKRVRVD